MTEFCAKCGPCSRFCYASTTASDAFVHQWEYILMRSSAYPPTPHVQLKYSHTPHSLHQAPTVTWTHIPKYKHQDTHTHARLRMQPHPNTMHPHVTTVQCHKIQLPLLLSQLAFAVSSSLQAPIACCNTAELLSYCCYC